MPVVVFLPFLMAAVMLVGCVKKERPVSVVVLGKDTLSLERIRTFVPDGEGDSTVFGRAVCRLIFARGVPADRNHSDTTLKKLARKLTLLSGVEYSTASAAMLLDASATLRAEMRTGETMSGVVAAIDSTIASFEASAGGTPIRCSLSEGDRTALKQLDKKKDLDKLLAIVLKVSSECAATLANFVSDNDSSQTAGMQTMIQGLIADTAVRLVSPAKQTRKTAYNTAAVLKFRPQESIRDSIAKHLPDLQQMYKRQLKTGDYSSGTVWVSFLVDCNGRVIDARIKKSQIANVQFLERLEKYLKIMAFKPVPKECGTMNFEFPFEFKAEEL
jgi:TonB family protein